MNALTLLKHDHGNVEELFRRFETCQPDDLEEMVAIRDSVVRQLSAHSQIEEQLFYPAVRAKLGDDDAFEVLEGLEEHHLVKKTLAELERMRPDNDRFRAKMTVLIENVRHHVEEEENELFEKVRGNFTVEELNDLGEAMENAKATVSERPHPLLPDQPPLNVLVGLPLALLDRGVSRARELVNEMARRGRDRDRKVAA